MIECSCGCGPFEPQRANQKYRTGACRTRAYEGRRAQRAASRQESVRRTPRRTRYAVVQLRGSVFEVLGFDSGRSRRAVERAFGIHERDDLVAVAESRLPIAAV